MNFQKLKEVKKDEIILNRIFGVFFIIASISLFFKEGVFLKIGGFVMLWVGIVMFITGERPRP